MYDQKRNITINLLVLTVLVCNVVQYKLVFGYNNAEVRCIEREREALLRFKKGLRDDYGLLRSWGNETRKKECCKWKGVRCSNTTGHVLALKLVSRDDYYLGGKINSALIELNHLKVLDLSGNDFGMNTIPEFICSMTQLEDLSLSYSNFAGIIPPQLGNLTNLQTLDLSMNYLRFENLNWLSHLSLLYVLDLSHSNIADANWLHHVLKLHSLQELHLYDCGLSDVEPSSLGLSSNSTISLSILDLSGNDLTSSTVEWLFSMNKYLVTTDLRELYLSENKLILLPSGIWQLPLLENLDVSFNSLEGTITEANLTKLHNLKFLDLSFNSLTLDINSNWVPHFQLDFIYLSGCKMGPSLPLWLRTQSNFSSLDISNNGISGEMPKWFWTLSPRLEYLYLSHNEINGTLPDLSPKLIKLLDVSFNKLSGPIPLFPPSSWLLQLSQNMFSGSISSICTTHYNIFIFLDLSNNQLAGELPNCWENMPHLVALNLANNSFSGQIPHALGYLSNLRTLHLRNNNFSGELPSTLKNCKYMEQIDVGDNMLTGNIPTWISALFLIFSHNRFEGSIPPQICSLSHIQVLDLSGNNLSGNIPTCFDKITIMVQKDVKSRWMGVFVKVGAHMHIRRYMDYGIVSWKRQELEYRKNLALLKLIDLSNNRLVGDIPKSFSSLKGLISLNLSRNSLTGNINPDIGRMEMLETLDLSNNQLSGPIPIGMTQLNFLAVLDFANNNLSGKIPTGRHLQTFNASSYTGNVGLCGSPLPLCPGDGPSANNKSRDIDDEKDDDGILSSSFFMDIVISTALGFILGFWGVVGSLIVKESWRWSFFNFWSVVGDWLYVSANILWAKFRRS